jgi:hypothetical protein
MLVGLETTGGRWITTMCIGHGMATHDHRADLKRLSR